MIHWKSISVYLNDVYVATTSNKYYLCAEEMIVIEETAARLGKSFSSIVDYYLKLKDNDESTKFLNDQLNDQLNEYKDRLNAAKQLNDIKVEEFSIDTIDYYQKHQVKFRNKHYNKSIARNFKHGNYKGKKW